MIERNGVITVRPPLKMTPEQVDETVLSKRMWIYRNLAEWRDLNATRVTREWVSGESFLYLGSSYRLQLVQEQDEPLKLKDGRFCLLRSIVEAGGNDAAHEAFEMFYNDKGLPRIKKRVAHFAAQDRRPCGRRSDQGPWLPLGLVPEKWRSAFSLEMSDGSADRHRLHRGP